MAVVIRLQRAGGRNRPFYRVVATDSRMARDGRFIEKLGFYNPLRDPIELTLDVAKIDEWVTKGARTSDTVAQLLKNYRAKAGAESQVQAE